MSHSKKAKKAARPRKKPQPAATQPAATPSSAAQSAAPQPATIQNNGQSHESIESWAVQLIIKQGTSPAESQFLEAELKQYVRH